MGTGGTSHCVDKRFEVIVRESDCGICGLNSNMVYEFGCDKECWQISLAAVADDACHCFYCQ